MHEETTRDHVHEEGREVHAHQRHSALREELVTHVPFSVGAVAVGLVMAGIICFLSPSTLDKPTGVICDSCGVSDSAHVVTGHEGHDHGAEVSQDPMVADHDHEAHDHDAHDHDAHENEAGHDHASHEGHEHSDHDEHVAVAAQTDHDGHDHAGHDHSSGFRPLFHLFHPLHMFFSAAATAAMFWRYEHSAIKGIIVGLIGAVGVCGVSDILMPHISLGILGIHLPFHVCVIEHPGMVLPFAFIGVCVGLLAAVGVARSTIFSHSIHVFVSTMASIFYMIVGYGRLGWIDDIGWIFLFIVLAVMVPCCLSDIIFPLALSKNARNAYSKESCCCH